MGESEGRMQEYAGIAVPTDPVGPFRDSAGNGQVLRHHFDGDLVQGRRGLLNNLRPACSGFILGSTHWYRMVSSCIL